MLTFKCNFIVASVCEDSVLIFYRWCVKNVLRPLRGRVSGAHKYESPFFVFTVCKSVPEPLCSATFIVSEFLICYLRWIAAFLRISCIFRIGDDILQLICRDNRYVFSLFRHIRISADSLHNTLPDQEPYATYMILQVCICRC